MPGNSFGELFRVTTAGVSHGPGYLAIIDGCPPGLALSEEDLLPDLRRRRPGQSKLVTQRKEEDVPEIWSGVFEGKYGFRDYRGGGRSSARETMCRVAAGAIAKKLLAQAGIGVLGYVKQVGDVTADI